MKSKVVDARLIGIGCILLSHALSSAAVTLGRHSGAAIIGRPLDIRVQATLAPGEDLASQCIGAEVFFGDAQVPAGQVRSTPIGSGAGAQVRIQSMQPVNEPIVSVDVRAGCTAPFTRRYVLLADPLAEPLVLPRVVPPAVVADSPAASPPPLADTRESSPVRVPDAPRQQTPRSVVRRTDAPEPATVARRPAAPAAVREPALATRDRSSRLQLDVLDLALQAERDPTLKLSMDLLSQPATAEARAQAGSWWQAISASPDERWRDVQRLAALEAEAQTLRSQEAQARATIADLNGRLASAESGRYFNGVVYALVLGLILALAALAVLWRRLASGRGNEPGMAWWAADVAAHKHQGQSDKATAWTPLDLDLTLEADSRLSRFPSRSGSEETLDSLPFSDKPLFPLSGKDRRDFMPSLTGAARSVATEELFDIQQQAEFFMSLGDDEQAIKVLRGHLADSAEPSALTYLDLLMLYHRLQRRDEYEQARAEFNQMFNAGAPPFDQYSEESRGLEDYEAAFGRIQNLWPDPRVLDVIEESIFRDPGHAQAEVFDLEAYRELLLLHAMAKDMIKRDVASEKSLLDFQHTNVEPLKVTAKKGAGRVSGAAVAAVGAGAEVVEAAAAESAADPVESGETAGAVGAADARVRASLSAPHEALAGLDMTLASDALPGSSPVALDVDLSDLATFSMSEALVMLHTMAKDMIKPEEGASEPGSEGLTPSTHESDAASMAVASLDKDRTAADVDDGDASSLQGPGTDSGALDLDLSEMSDFSLFETALPELPSPVEQAVQTPAANDEIGNQHPENLIEFDMPDFLMPDDPWSSERTKRGPGA